MVLVGLAKLRLNRYVRYPKEKEPLPALYYSVRFGLLSSSPTVLGSQITLNGIFLVLFWVLFLGSVSKLQILGQKNYGILSRKWS